MDGITKSTDGLIHNFGTKVVDHELLAKGAEAQELETRSAPMDDFGGDGKAIVLRRFQYQLPPRLKPRPSKAEFAKYHLPRIIPFLYKDGLEQLGEPKVVFEKKGKVSIFITASPRRGQLLKEKPQTLKELYK